MSDVTARSGLFPEWHARAPRKGHLDTALPWEIVGATDNLQLYPFGAQGRSALLVEGFLFEPAAHAAAVGLAGQSASMPQVIAEAYQRWGDRFFEHLDGQFLVAVWDEAAGTLLLGHDAMGRHPVYYAITDSEILFSSNIFGLAYSGRTPRQPNRLSLALRLYGLWPQASDTAFAGIHRLPPGHLLQVGPGGTGQQRCFWNAFPEDAEDLGSPRDALALFGDALQGATARCMERDPQGVLLSGGLDSVGVAVAAADYVGHHQRAPLTACVARPPRHDGPSWEEPYQDKVAARLQMPLQVSRPEDWLGERALLEATSEEIPRHPGPTDLWWAGSYIGFYRFLAGQGLTRLLTGSGGDEWLGVHPAYAADLLRAGAFGRLSQFARAEIATGGRGGRYVAYDLLWRYGFRLLLRSLLERHAVQTARAIHRRHLQKRVPAWLCPDNHLREELVTALHERAAPLRDARGVKPRSFYHHVMAHLWRNPLMAEEFEHQFHITRSLGLELHHPYHDQRLSALCNRLSPDALMREADYKGLLRAFTARKLQGFGLERQRKVAGGGGRTGYVNRELQTGLPAFAAAFGYHRLAGMGLVNPRAWSAHRPPGSSDDDFPLATAFRVAAMEAWLQTHMR